VEVGGDGGVVQGDEIIFFLLREGGLGDGIYLWRGGSVSTGKIGWREKDCYAPRERESRKLRRNMYNICNIAFQSRRW
jgi:hypothetical protein